MGGHRLTARVIELSPWVEYEFRVVAINTLGTGEPSKPSKQIRTKDTGKGFKDACIALLCKIPLTLALCICF